MVTSKKERKKREENKIWLWKTIKIVTLLKFSSQYNQELNRRILKSWLLNKQWSTPLV